MSPKSSARSKTQRSAPTASNKSLAPVLGTRKDGQATASSARGLLLTVLGELVLPNGGTAWTQTLIEILAELGVEEKAARQSISRLAERGWLSSTKIGRRTRWALTPEVQDLLEVGAARIYAFGQDAPLWSGEWLLLSASVPERDRKIRYQLTSGLNWAGFGALGQGWWISPRPDREQEAQRVLNQAGIEDVTSFVARQGSMGDPISLAQRAWNLEEVYASYEQFLHHAATLANRAPQDDETASTRARTASDVQESRSSADAAANLIQLVHSWRRFPFLDPDLPAELLAPDWPGHTAAQRFRELHDLWRPDAQQWWQDTQRRFSR